MDNEEKALLRFQILYVVLVVCSGVWVVVDPYNMGHGPVIGEFVVDLVCQVGFQVAKLF